MNELVVDSATARRLMTAGGTIVVKDEFGRVIGRLLVEDDPSQYEIPEDHGLSPEELARRLAPDAKTYTTAEVLAYLRSLR